MLKKIVNYFKKNNLNKINILEEKRKLIHSRLPEGSFSKKLYSHERLDKEIALLKIGKKVIDVSHIRRKNAVGIKVETLINLAQKYDLSKATLIHTHINQNRSQIFMINPVDLLMFSKFNKHFNTRRFEISMIDKDHIEYKRVFIQFSEQTINWIKNNGMKNISNEIYMADRLHFNTFSAGYMSSFLKQKGIIIREVPVNIK